MSTLRADTIQNTSGGAVTLTDQIAVKHYAMFDGATNTIDESYNMSSLTDNSTGNYSTNFTNSMSTSTFGLSLGGSWNRTYGMAEARTTSYARGKNATFALAASDGDDMHHIVVGDLA